MTADEAIKELKELKDGNNTIEMKHSAADEILLELLQSLGQGEVVEAYEELRNDAQFYYA
jgi:hypothetical protein